MMLNLALKNPSTKATYAIFGTVFTFILFISLAYTHLDSWRFETRPERPFSPPAPVAVPDTPIEPPKSANHGNVSNHQVIGKYHDALREAYLKEMYYSRIQVDEEKYVPYGVFETKLPKDPKWNEPMGKNFCIIDLDSRGFDEPFQLFGKHVMSWNNATELHGLSLGMLNHWLYAKIHGYKYYWVAANDYDDRRASWKKPPIISEILKNHEACVYLDSDAIFTHLDLPFEWLMNYWEIDHKKDVLALATDPDEDYNKDEFDRLYLNTGFIIAQNTPKVYEILKAWETCPDEGSEYDGCDQFRTANPGRPTDQGGFGTYIRYDYKKYIKELPCDEANGYAENGQCKGKFIMHLWTGKDDHIKVAVGEKLPGKMLELFHEQMRAEKKQFWITEDELMRERNKKEEFSR